MKPNALAAYDRLDLMQAYLRTLNRTMERASLTGCDGMPIDFSDAVTKMGFEARAAHANGNKLMFVGNGGSAGICSHMAIDFSKNAQLRAMAFNDAAALTCLSNDLGYEKVFAKQVELHARPGDILIAISSSGRSANILGAVAAARNIDCKVYTLSGFDSDNPLRALGDINVYLPSREYGFVELGHLTVLHAVLDIQMGWTSAS